MQIQFKPKNIIEPKPRLWFQLLFWGLCLLLCAFFYSTHSFSVRLELVLLLLCFPVFSAFKIQVSNPFYAVVVHGILTVSLAVLYLFLARYIHWLKISSLPKFRIEMNLLIFSTLTFLLYCLTGKSRIAYTLAFTILILMEVINYYLISFRGVELSPADLFSVRTAANVIGQYKVVLTRRILYTLIGCLLVGYFMTFTLEIYESAYTRGGAVLLLLAQIAVVGYGLQLVNAGHFKHDGTDLNGFALNFLKSVSEMFISVPEDYNSRLEVLERTYQGQNPDAGADYPNIIVVMNESFTDLRIFNDDPALQSVMPFIDSLQENTIKGFAQSSVFGGSTPNSEWEFLTGNTIAYTPPGSIPYQTFIHSDSNPSMVSHLKSLGYRCIAMHPCSQVNWARNTVYPKLGFDEQYFEPDFPGQNLIHDNISDQELYEKMISRFEQKSPGEKCFLFAVTMQNHGPYGNPDLEGIPIGSDHAYPSVEYYLSLLQASDSAVKQLISYFQTVDENTVILFFGDHQPDFDVSYQDDVNPLGTDTLDGQELMYTVPFFIWANYEIEESFIPCTSLNFLGNHLYRTAQLPTTGYRHFLQDLETKIPSINAYGFYSPSEGHFLPIQDAQGHEADWLHDYHVLQYNNLFDTKHRSPIFAP